MFKKLMTLSLAALVLAAVATVAEARNPCDRYPGYWPGRDGRCHPAATASPNRNFVRRPVTSTRRTIMPAKAPAAIPMEDQKAFRAFVDRCNEQAAKRTAILGVEVRPQFTGGVDKASTCHIPAGFSERGAL